MLIHFQSEGEKALVCLPEEVVLTPESPISLPLALKAF